MGVCCVVSGAQRFFDMSFKGGGNKKTDRYGRSVEKGVYELCLADIQKGLFSHQSGNTACEIGWIFNRQAGDETGLLIK